MSYYLSVVKNDPEKLANKRQKEKLWQDNNRGRLNKKQRERAQANKLKAIEYLGGKCKICGGVFHPSVYDFHHRDPTEKEFGVNRIKWRQWESIKPELDKCDLLCSNCHRELHYKLEEQNDI